MTVNPTVPNAAGAPAEAGYHRGANAAAVTAPAPCSQTSRCSRNAVLSSTSRKNGHTTLVFTGISMLKGDAKWYDAVQRVTGVLAAQQDSDRLVYQAMFEKAKDAATRQSLFSPMTYKRGHFDGGAGCP